MFWAAPRLYDAALIGSGSYWRDMAFPMEPWVRLELTTYKMERSLSPIDDLTLKDHPLAARATPVNGEHFSDDATLGLVKNGHVDIELFAGSGGMTLGLARAGRAGPTGQRWRAQPRSRLQGQETLQRHASRTDPHARLYRKSNNT